jgi:hypothetical protein
MTLLHVRQAREGVLGPPVTWPYDSLRNSFKIGDDALDRRRPRVSPVPQIEDKPWISNGFSSKTGGGSFMSAEELLYFS